MNSMSSENNKPGWGATIGVFFLSWLVGGFCCGIASLFFAQAAGYAMYTVGGLITLILGICGAAYYRSTGKMGGAMLIAVIGGIAIGVITIAMALNAIR